MLNKSSTRSFTFSPRFQKGFDIHNPSALYCAKHLSFIFPVFDNDEDNVRERARSSLSLHMRKRKVPQAPATESSFAGFQGTEAGILVKNSKVTWPRSSCVHLKELCVREGVMLEKRLNYDTLSLIIEMNKNVTATTTDVKQPSHCASKVPECKCDTWVLQSVAEKLR